MTGDELWSALQRAATESDLSPAEVADLLLTRENAPERFREEFATPIAWLMFRFAFEASEWARIQIPVLLALMKRGQADISMLLTELREWIGECPEVFELLDAPVEQLEEEIREALARPYVTERGELLEEVVTDLAPRFGLTDDVGSTAEEEPPLAPPKRRHRERRRSSRGSISRSSAGRNVRPIGPRRAQPPTRMCKRCPPWRRPPATMSIAHGYEGARAKLYLRQFRRGEVAIALENVQRLMVNNPDDAPNWREIELCLLLRLEAKGAVEELLASHEYAPSIAGYAYLVLGHADGVLRVLGHDQTCAGVFMRAWALSSLGRWEEAVSEALPLFVESTWSDLDNDLLSFQWIPPETLPFSTQEGLEQWCWRAMAEQIDTLHTAIADLVRQGILETATRQARDWLLEAQRDEREAARQTCRALHAFYARVPRYRQYAQSLQSLL